MSTFVFNGIRGSYLPLKLMRKNTFIWVISAFKANETVKYDISEATPRMQVRTKSDVIALEPVLTFQDGDLVADFGDVDIPQEVYNYDVILEHLSERITLLYGEITVVDNVTA